MSAKKRVVRNKRRAATRLGVLLLLFLVVIGCIVGLVLLLSRRSSPSLAFSSLPFSASDPYVYRGTGFLYISGNEMGYHDLKDSSKDYTLSISTSDVSLAGSENIAVVYSQNALQIVGAEYPIACADPIVYLKCGKTHIAVLCRNAQTGAEKLLIYDTAGVQTDELDSGDGFMMDVGFTGGTGDVLWVQIVHVDSSISVSTITTYDLDKASTKGVVQVQNQIIEKLYFTNNSMYAAGTNQIIRYSSSNKESYREMIYGWRVLDAYLSDTSAFLLTPRASVALSAVKVCMLAEGDVSQRQETYMQLPPDSVCACIMGGQLAVVARDEVITYSLTGTKRNTYSLEEPVNAAVKLDDSTLLLTVGNSMYTAVLK